MKICFLSAMHTPLDKRVFQKEAKTLASQGFTVVHLAPGERDTMWTQDGVTILTFSVHLRSHLHRLWHLRRLYRLAVRVNADCYHCNELDTWLVGCVLKVTRRKTVIVDVHELYPAHLAERYPFLPKRMAKGIIRALYSGLSLFTDNIVLAYSPIGVDFPARTRVKQVVVENFASRSMIVRPQPSLAAPRPVEGSLVAITHGLMGRSRGWPQILTALTLSSRSRLHLVGSFFDDSRCDFDAQVRELNLERRVLVEDWLPFEALQERLLKADIGLVLFQPGGEGHVHGMPHKLFDFMAAGLAVIVPRTSTDLAQLVHSSDCGLAVDPTAPIEIARALDSLAADPDERRRLGNNGRRAVAKRYNWETEAAKLVSMYREHASSRC